MLNKSNNYASEKLTGFFEDDLAYSDPEVLRAVNKELSLQQEQILKPLVL